MQMKKSPRAPSMPLQEAIERASMAFDRTQLDEVPTDMVARNIGYKSANSGAALSTIASLRYFGLLVRTKNGFLAVSRGMESYRLASSEVEQRALLLQFLTSPPLFADLLKKHDAGLPSDAALRRELLERGFNQSGVDAVLQAFTQSVAFAQYFPHPGESNAAALQAPSNPQHASADETTPPLSDEAAQQAHAIDQHGHPGNGDGDSIPVRLSGGRRAWLVIPNPFYQADKARLKAQIDLLLADDEDA